MKTYPLQCPAGHHEMLPWATASLAWCDQCKNRVQFTPVPNQDAPARVLLEDANEMEKITSRVAGRFREYEQTWQAARGGTAVLLAPDPKSEQEKKLVAALRTAGFPDRHIARLKTMDKNGISIAREVDDILSAKPGPVACILWGDYSRGKTQTACAVGMLRAQRGERTRYTPAAEIISGLRDNMRLNIPDTALLRRYREAACLIIDDIQAALDEVPEQAKWARAHIQGIVDHRYRTGAPLKTIILANAADEDQLNLRLGGHILSRVAEDGKVIRLNSKDYRTKNTPPP